MPWRARLRRIGVLKLLLGLGSFLLSWHIFRIGDINFTLSDAAFVMCLGLLVSRRLLNPKPFGGTTVPFNLGLLLMLGGLLMGSVTNGDPLRWIVIAAQYVFAYMLVPMILMSIDRSWLRRCLVFYAVGVAAAQAIAIGASFIFTYADTVQMLGMGFITGRGRIGAFAGDANWNGFMVASALPILLNAVMRRDMPVLLSIPVAIALVWGLLGSASFTGFSAAAAALAIYFLISNPRNALKIGAPLVLLATGYITSGLPLPGAFQDRVVGALDSGDMAQAGTYTGRKALANEAWRRSNDTVLIGMGADMYREVSVYNMPVHVFPLLILNEGGAIALLGLLVLAVSLGLLCMRAIGVQRDDGALALALFAIFMIFSLSTPHMYARLWLSPLFLALGVSFGRQLSAAPKGGVGAAAADMAADRRGNMRGRARQRTMGLH